MTTQGTTRPTPWIWAILILFLVLCNVYGLVTPIFEASDELFHYPVVDHMASRHKLPVQDPDDVQAWVQEGGQPPLYYVLMAVATFWIDGDDFPEKWRNNPHAKIGIPLALDNKNMVIHTADEGFPFRKTAMAVHAIRFLSSLLAVGTVWLTYAIAREVVPESCLLALVAAAVVAFNPMFLFISASVNNDNLAVLLASLALWLMVRLIRTGATLGRVAVLGVVLGLAALTKLSLLGLLFLAAITVTWDAWQRRSWRRWIGYGLLLGVLVLVIAGWWYARNWVLYQDPLGFSVWLEISGARDHSPSAAELLGEFEGFRISFWGLFGAVNVLMHPLTYKFYDLLALLALAGLVIGGARWLYTQAKGRDWRTVFSGDNPRSVQMIILGLWILILVVLLIRWTKLTPASQGRLIFPGIASIAFWLALGWRSLAPKRWRRAILGTIVAALLILATVAPWAYIAPAYAAPAMAERIPSELEPVGIRYADQFEVIGFRLPEREVFPGQSLNVELGWRALAPMEEDYSLFVHLYGREGELLGQADTYPGGGLLPTSHLSPGDQFVEVIEVPVARGTMAPMIARVVVGLYLYPEMTMLPASDPAGAELGTNPTLARFKVAASKTAPVDIPETVDFELGPRLALAGYDLSAAPGSVTLYWRASEAVTKDLTVFVHLIDESGGTVAQADSQPQAGAYPTSFWSAGEVVVDRHDFSDDAVEALVPGGLYHLHVGLYDLQSGARLPVRSGDAAIGDHIVFGPIAAP